MDELGKINNWVSDDRRNLEAPGTDPILLQLRGLIDKQKGVDNHMYGITTTASIMGRIPGRLTGHTAIHCTEISSRPSSMYAACHR